MADLYQDHDIGLAKQQRRNTLKSERQLMLERFLYAMKEDLADWLSSMMGTLDGLSADSFMTCIENGVILCQHANLIQDHIEEFRRRNPPQRTLKLPKRGCLFKAKGATPGSFIARDNVANFISWCREFGISEVVIFESEDLVLRKNERSVVLTLLDVARRASKVGVRPPEIVKFEEEIELEIERDKKEPERTQRNYVMERDNDLDHLVQEVINQCTCPIQFPITKVGEGKYKVGQNTTLIFVRVMRNHVMVRVGGGWDTLEHYIEKHDPCRIQDRIESSRSSRNGQNAMENGSDTCSACSSESLESNPYLTPRRTRRFSSNSTDMQNDGNGEELTQSFRRANTDMGPFRYQSRRTKEDSDESRRAVSLETELKDCSVYDSMNPSDSWLRRQLNEIKRESTIKDVQISTKVVTTKGPTTKAVSPRTQKSALLRERRDSKGEQIPSGLPRPTFTSRSQSWSLNGTESKKFHQNRAVRSKLVQPRTVETNGSVVAKRRKSSPSDMAGQRPVRIPQREGSFVRDSDGRMTYTPLKRSSTIGPAAVARSGSMDRIQRPRRSEVAGPLITKSKTMDLPGPGRVRATERKTVQTSTPKRGTLSTKQGTPISHNNENIPGRANKAAPKTPGQRSIEAGKPTPTTYRKKEPLNSPTKQSQGSCRANHHQLARHRPRSAMIPAGRWLL